LKFNAYNQLERKVTAYLLHNGSATLFIKQA